MWHIVLIGYLFVAVMYSAAQPSIARALIYLVFWAVLPVAFTVFVITIRRRNRLMKQQEKEAFEQSRRAAGQEGSSSEAMRIPILYEPFIFSSNKLISS